MIKINPELEPHRLALADALHDQMDLSGPEVAILTEELATDPEGMGYSGASRLELLQKLNTPYSRPNPVGRGLVARTGITKDEYAPLCSRLMLRGGQLTGQAKVVWESMKDAVLALGAQASINFLDQDVIAGVAGLRALGLLAGGLDDQLTKCPDPNYQETLSYPSRAEALFGVGTVLDVLDLEGIL